MSLRVMKFGGTSVGSVDRIQAVADRIAAAVRAGDRVVAVCSAMSGETNRLIALAHEVSARPLPREYDVLVATGEQASIALVAMALNDRGVAGRSFTGLQAAIRTDRAHTKARIVDIDPQPLRAALERGEVPVVAGFQGIDAEANTTTLGRGGSDLTAVAIAHALNADVCEIYTDVDGVYTCDPNVVPSARKIERISYEEMLELASLGAKVLQTRSVELAMKVDVPLHVRSSFDTSEGTWVTREVPEMEDILVSGIAYNNREAKISLIDVPDQPGIASSIFSTLADQNINVDMIIQNISIDGTTDMTFTVAETDLDAALDALRSIQSDVGWEHIETDREVAKLSVVGVGMRSHAGVAAKMFQTLAAVGINIQMISTSEIKISVVIERKYVELAARELHSAFGLDASA
ncbi:MAG: aspartate kinase [Candidatus Dadabacteria bacterium]|nr:MAG: aspartate kinase [Candidatus Dadabacteria bacterium]